MRYILPRLAGALLVLAAALPAGAQQAATAPSKAIDPANIDTTCSACQDFFRYANGGWIKRTEIPAAYSRWGSFNELSDKNQDVVRAILEESRAAKNAAAGSNVQKIGDYYGACMDSAHVESHGTKPLQPMLRQIAMLSTAADVQRQVARMHAAGVGALFGFGAGQDRKESTRIVAQFSQGGLGMPDRDYYTRPGADAEALRQKYVAHVARMLELAGTPAAQAKADAQRVMALETQLANASMTRVQRRDPNATYNKMTLAGLQEIAPNVNWRAYVDGVGAKGVGDVIVGQPEYFKAVSGLMKTVPVADWKAYLRWRLVNDAAPQLGSAFANASFAWTQNLTGAKEQLPRWRRCAAATNSALGELVGQEYVKRTFTPEAKARALEMVENLRAALREQIQGLAWMSDTTKRQAIAKLEAFTPKIGYPDKWRDYSALTVKPGQYAENAMRAGAWSVARNLAKLGKPVDRTEWGMTPPTVNAYYSPVMNEIAFPAGILQPPFFDPNADDAVNYGGIGAVIGHEMTHGFDDSGRQYDLQGNLKDWWTATDAENYKARAKLVVDQFSGYTVVDSATRVNGQLTLGENIADLGGLKIAYKAFQKSLEGKPRPANIDGFTPEQRFFLGWAQVWRGIQRDEAARTQVNTDSHSPAVWRVNGPLSNMPEFRDAFGCKEGDRMVRPESVRAEIW